MPRILDNGDISLPCNVAYVVKKIEGFDSKACSADVALTTIMRIKCTDLEDREEVMKFLEEKLKARINEVEHKIVDKCFKIQRTKSQDCKENDKDMV